MNTPNQAPPSPVCAACGAPLPDDSPADVCPACLGQAALDSEAPTAGDPASAKERPEPPQPEDIAGHFPNLEILELIGQGGMGVVYKARQTNLDRIVALKVLAPDDARDPAFAERFQREARALAKLNHPGIVSVYDVGKAGPYYFFLMEFVEGVNLRQMVQSKRLTPEEAFAIVPKICEALQYAHDEGIVHRDIKPANILVDKQGRVKIADFGLAKLLGAGPGDITLTAPEQVMGTMHYMAPEQMEGSPGVDHRADIYSLGVVFYELLTGNLPVGRFAPPSKRVHIDVRLDEVVLRTLEYEPGLRYQTAGEVKTDVETITRAGASPTPPSSDDGAGVGGKTIWALLALFAAGWLTLGFLFNAGWIGLALGTAGMCALLLAGLHRLAASNPDLRTAIAEEPRAPRRFRVACSLLLFALAVAAVVRIHIDPQEQREKKDAYLAFSQIEDGESAASRQVMERLPAYRDSEANQTRPELWIGSGSARFRVPGNQLRSLSASAIPLALTLWATWLLTGTTRHRRSWTHRRKPGLILAATSLGSVLLIAFVNLMHGGGSWNRGWPTILCAEKFDLVSQELDDWAEENGYEVRGDKTKEIHLPTATSDSNQQIGSLRVLWIRPASMFDRYRVTPRGIRRPKPTLVVTLVGNLNDPYQTHVSLNAGSYRQPSNEEAEWQPLIDSLTDRFRAFAQEAH